MICGELHPDDLKPEGPFGDHLGYYSLVHDFPVLKVHKVYAKKMEFGHLQLLVVLHKRILNLD